ncbi:MAG: PHP domain-containing protein [Gemmatimonadota bacterium]
MKEGRRADLHVHSTASDGLLPPAEVVKRAAAVGLSAMALTDHDTVEGIPEASAEAKRQGIALLPAAELSANEPGLSVHLLAYGFDPGWPELRSFLEAYREDRIRRAREMVNRLNALGVGLRNEDIRRETGRAAPTRAHVARALVGRGLARDAEEVFRRFLSRGGPAFVEKRATSPAEVIGKVHAAGGVVLLAHPGRTHGPAAIRRWAGQGLDGVEVLHPENSPAVRARLGNLAAELGLLRCGGSDWHGPHTHRASLGSEPVPVEWFEEIAARCRAGGGGTVPGPRRD